MQINSEFEQMSYADFVAYLEQENSPPGGLPTIQRWSVQAGIGSASRVLDLACSTGFSGRTIAKETRCEVRGLDISEAAITEARHKAAAENLTRAWFDVGSATEMPYPDDHFDVAVAGSSFGFITARERALDETARVLVPGGRLCIANFAYHTRPPEALLDQVRERAGFRPEAHWTREYWNEFFGRRLELAYDETIEIEPLDPREVTQHVAVFVATHDGRLARAPSAVKQSAFRRLLKDRLVFNEHARYQTRNIQVWARLS